MRRTAHLLCLWSGPVFVVGLIVGFMVLSGFVPPPSPAAGEDEIAGFYREDTTGILAGCVVSMFASAFLLPWAIGIAAQTRRGEHGFPVLAYVQIGAAAINVAIAMVVWCVYATAAYRPETTTPETLRTLNDLGWILFLWDVSPLCMWLAAIGLSILLDRSEPSVFPRWAGYLTLWVTFTTACAGLVPLFKRGVFAWNGLIAFWVALGVFFVWVVIITVLAYRALTNQDAIAAGGEKTGPGSETLTANTSAAA